MPTGVAEGAKAGGVKPGMEAAVKTGTAECARSGVKPGVEAPLRAEVVVLRMQLDRSSCHPEQGQNRSAEEKG